MSFLDDLLNHLRDSAERVVLQEIHCDSIVSVTGGELLQRVQAARSGLREAGLRKGDRCAFIASNSVQWAAIDLAIIAEAGIVVPLYSRQAPAELVGMMRDASISLLICE